MLRPRANKVPKWKVPRQYRTWVYDQGSLTKRLINASNKNFRVNVTFQGWAVPNLEERRILKFGERRLALVREVELLCYDQVWVKARSIIPVTTLTGKERQLQYLGNKPLGAFLFKSKGMARSDLESVSLTVNNKRIFGRRSVFYLSDKPLLVSELFMPDLFGQK
jgi:chorismate--pyruvate lyase